MQHPEHDGAADDRRRRGRERDPHQVHVVEEAPRARGPRLVRFRFHPADDARLQPRPVVGRPRRGGEAQRVADGLQHARFGQARRALVEVILDRDLLADFQLVVVERRQTTPHYAAGEPRHTSLNSARKASRARASRDLTVPTAIPSENPISS